MIQKVTNKKKNPYGEHKELIVDSLTITVGTETKTKYYYTFSKERYDRPIKDAYKIMIHESYRENKKVKKRQWVICTMDFYSLIESWPGDCIHSSRLNDLLKRMGIEEDELWKMVLTKLNPIVEEATKKFKSSPEYKAKKKHEKILATYRKEKEIFESVYGKDTFDYCYDVFINLRNKKFHDEVVSKYRAEQERKSSYSNSSYGNYGNTDDFFKNFSSYFGNIQSTYNDAEKVFLKKIYRSLSKNFHPDITKDDGEIMKFINKLKDGWGI